MWRPHEQIHQFNKVLVRLEQDLLAVYRGAAGLTKLVDSQVLADLNQLIDGDPRLAIQMARIKSGHAMTPRHAVNVLLMARAWARLAHRLGDRLNDFCRAALLHDLGHWRPASLVYVFGPFTHEEARKMRGHVQPNDEDLARLHPDIIRWIAQHHEQPDGKGYPGTTDKPEPLAQLLRVVDCHDGLCTPRRFRATTYTWAEAMTLMGRWAGFKFSRGIFKSFRQTMGNWPAGSFLRLEDGAVAVSLPPGDELGNVLMLTNSDGDALAEPAPGTLAPEAIVGEAARWQEVRLPEPWQALRPDLMGLPRFYPSEPK